MAVWLCGCVRTREGDYKLYDKPEARLSRDDLLPAPPSISLWAAIVVDEWTLTMVAWSQLLRLPLKLVACCTMAVVAVISKRFDPAYRYVPAPLRRCIATCVRLCCLNACGAWRSFSLAQPPLQEHQGLGDPIVVGFLSMMLSGVWADLSPLAIDTSFVYQVRWQPLRSVWSCPVGTLTFAPGNSCTAWPHGCCTMSRTFLCSPTLVSWSWCVARTSGVIVAGKRGCLTFRTWPLQITGGAPLGWGRSLVESSITHYSRFERVMTLVYIVRYPFVVRLYCVQLLTCWLPFPAGANLHAARVRRDPGTATAR